MAASGVLRSCRILFWSAAIVAFVMAALPQPPQVPGAPSDKVLHILAFTALGVLASAGYPRVPAWRLVLGLSTFGALIEIVQMIPSLHRDAELMDWVADTVAAAAAVAFVRGWRLLRNGGK